MSPSAREFAVPRPDGPSGVTAEAVRAVFGTAADQAETFAGLLRGAGVERGLLGPREGARIWERHLFNCAAVAVLIPEGERIVDLGSGAGLPGLVLAIRRPDLHVDLVEPMERRCAFLTEAVSALALGARVRVVRGRAEEPGVLRLAGGCGIVTARAVAPLDRLARWALPLLRPGGRLLAMKGDRGAQELLSATTAIRRCGGAAEGIRECEAVGGSAVRVAVVRRTEAAQSVRGSDGEGGGRGRAG